VKANYKLSEKDRMYLSGYFGRDSYRYPGFFANQWGNDAATLRWNHQFSKKLFSNTTVTYSNYDYNLINYENSTGFEWNSSIENWSAKSDLTAYLRNNELSFGFQALTYNFQPGNIKPYGNSATTPTTLEQKIAVEPAVYVSNQQTVSPWLTLQYGLRVTAFARMGTERIQDYANNQPVVYNPRTGRHESGAITGSRLYRSGENIKSYYGFEPRFAALAKLNDRQSVKLSYNRINQYLHLISNTTSATPLDIWTPSGPYLKPQIGDQVAAGYFTSFGNGFDLSAETYYKWINNVPDFVDGAELLFNDFVETEILAGRARAYGLEMQLKKTTGKLTGWANYTWSRSLRTIQGINNGEEYASNYDKPHQFSVTGSYVLTKRWTLAANFVFASGAPITYPEGKYNYGGFIVSSYNNRNQDRLPAYHRLDISATLKTKNGNGQWVFGIYNAYNRVNAATIFFREKVNVTDAGVQHTGTTEAVKYGIFGIIPSVSYEFKF
jgi:hypothetical protein